MIAYFYRLFLFLKVLVYTSSSYAAGKSCMDIFREFHTKNKKLEIVWEVDSTLPNGLSLIDYKNTTQRINNFLQYIPHPEKIVISIKKGNIPLIGLDGTDVIPLPLVLKNDFGEALNPSHNLKLLAHEYTHRFVNEYISSRDPLLMERIVYPKSKKKIESILNRIGKEGEDVQQLMAQLRELKVIQEIDLTKGELLRAYDELLADLVGVLSDGDPRSIYKLLYSPKADQLYSIAAQYRRFDLTYGKANIHIWLQDMSYYQKQLNTINHDRYLLFAPARSWLWKNFFSQSSKAGNTLEIAKRLRILFDATYEELVKKLELLEQGAVLDPLQTNLDLISSFQKALE